MTDLKIAREGWLITAIGRIVLAFASHWLTVSLCESAALEMFLNICHASYLRV